MKLGGEITHDRESSDGRNSGSGQDDGETDGGKREQK